MNKRVCLFNDRRKEMEEGKMVLNREGSMLGGSGAKGVSEEQARSAEFVLRSSHKVNV